MTEIQTQPTPTQLQVPKPPKRERPKTPTLDIDLLDTKTFSSRFLAWSMYDKFRSNSPFIYRINDGISNNVILQQVCEERGWVEYQEPSVIDMNYRERSFYRTSSWNLWWSYNFYQGSPFRSLKGWQYTNHNPRAFQFCNKSYLTLFLRKMTHEFGELYNFSPAGFIMPCDYIQFLGEHTRRQGPNCPDAQNIYIPNRPGTADKFPRKTRREQVFPVWILKPIGKSQGRGIFLTKDIGIVATSQRCVVQEYISRPLLIGGYKWDIRIYVLIASTDPLVIYMYREGLCRFATEKFNMNDLSALFSHLTNASLNKMAPDYATDKEVIGEGCKWSLKQLRTYFKQNGVSDWLLWQRIMSMVLLTVVGEGLKSGYLFPTNRNCFDFFGFDILVDETMRPWLLEVNYSPGLGGDCNVDEIVKKPMLHELFNLLGFPMKSKPPSDKPRPGTGSSRPTTADRRKATTPKSASRPRSAVVNDFSEPLDSSCKGRLRDATSIYNQELVKQFFENTLKNPKFRMNASMKSFLEKKQQHFLIKEGREGGNEESNYYHRQSNKENKDKESKENKDKEVKTDENNNVLGSESMSEDRISRPITATATRSRQQATRPGSAFSKSKSRPTTSETQQKVKRPFKDYSPVPSFGENTGEKSPYIYLKRQDWSHAPKVAGDWVLIYPCKALPYRSPYRSSLSDLRGIVHSIESYLRLADFVFRTHPNETDPFYVEKLKNLAKWNIEVWAPPPPEKQDDKIIVPFLE